MTAPGYGRPDLGPPPDNKLVWAVLSAVLCLPLGVLAVVRSTEVNGLWARGQYDAARRSAADAEKFASWAATAGIAGVVVYVLILLIAAIASN